MDRLEKAIAEFTDDTLDLSLSVRMSNLRSAWLWKTFKYFSDIQKNGLKSKLTEEEEYKMIEGMKQFEKLERMYAAEVRAAKLEGKNSEDVGKDWIKQLKDTPSEIGSIVRDLRHTG